MQKTITTVFIALCVLMRVSAVYASDVVSLKPGLPFASQVKSANTIYEIKSVYDLKGASISLPSNVTLVFNGGTIKNGTLTGDMATLDGSLNRIFDRVTLQGTYTNSESDLCWWACVPFNELRQVDNSANIQCAFDSSVKIVNVSKMYGVSSPIELPGSSRIQGVCAWGFKNAGFIANKNFSSKSVSLQRDGKKYVAKGMFYHFYDKHPSFCNITIDANKHTQFAVEQLAGYSWCDMENVYIEGALTAGILQYGAEQPFFKRVTVRNCHIGVIVSTSRFLDEDINTPSGAKVSMCNIVNFSECYFGYCNYGCVVFGGSNYVFDSCKTGCNAICGLIINGTSAVVANYYSERDGLCNYWIDRKTGVVRNASNVATVSKDLINHSSRLDGFSSKFNTGYDGMVYYRAPVVVNRSNVIINGAFISIKPRGKEETDVKIIVEATPTEKSYSGVDALFLVRESGLTVNNLTTYLHSSNVTSNAYPFATVIDLVPDNVGACPSRVVVNAGFRSNGGWSPTIFATSNSKSAAGGQGFYLDGPRYDACRSYYSLSSPVHDYNSDIELRLYGASEKYDFRTNEYVEAFNGFPLYKKLRRDNLYLSRSTMTEKFGNKRQVKLVAYVKVIDDFSGIIQFKTSFVNKSYSNEKVINGLNASTCDFKKGVYRLEMVADLLPKQSLGISKTWEYMKIALYGEPSVEVHCLFSDIYLYDLEDGQMLPHTFVSGVQL